MSLASILSGIALVGGENSIQRHKSAEWPQDGVLAASHVNSYEHSRCYYDRDRGGWRRKLHPTAYIGRMAAGWRSRRQP